MAGHFVVFSNWGVPLFAMLLLRWLRTGHRREAIWGGVVLGSIGLFDANQFSLTLVLALVVVAGVWWLRTPRAERFRVRPSPSEVRRWGGGLVAMGLSGIAVLLPLVLPLLGSLRGGDISNAPLSGAKDFGPDLVGYFTPSYFHPIWGKFGSQIADRLHFLDIPKVVFVGYIALGLALLALAVRAHRNVRRWWLVTVLFWLLSMGPVLKVNGADHLTADGFPFTLPLPFVLFHLIPVLGSGILVPQYAESVMFLGLAILAGYGLVWMCRRVSYGAGLGLCALAAGIVLIESMTVPIPLQGQPRVNPVYSKLAAEPDHLAVLEEPLGWQTELGGFGHIDAVQLYYATVSHKPVVSGYVSRVSDRFMRYYDRPVLSAFVSPEKPLPAEAQNGGNVSQALHQLNVGYLILHHTDQFDKLNSYVRQTLGYQPYYEDPELVAFKVPQ
ncbi:MAG: hypothetical protein JOZ39_01300 [Chloroflexi bacterium]|nr:hypothetical protein [Chloroflexota bacterium]